jgi:putative membrane protein
MALRRLAPILLCVLPVLAWSAWHPHDWPTWWLEIVPAFIGFAALFVAARKGWVFSPFAQVCIVLHMILLIVGGHYTYAMVPLGEWAKHAFGFTRNHYDRLGHFVQGFVPAVLFREVVVRNGVLARRGWLGFLTVCFCMAVSALYELFEWSTALISAQASESFLGTQGDPWDTQEDMFSCLIGVSTAVIVASLFKIRCQNLPVPDPSSAIHS